MIFIVMFQFVVEYGVVNLGQGFLDFFVLQCLIDEIVRVMVVGLNQYLLMIGVVLLCQVIVQKVLDCYGVQVDVDSEIIVISGGIEVIFNVIYVVVCVGEEVIVFDLVYDCYELVIDLVGVKVVYVLFDLQMFVVDWDCVCVVIILCICMLIVNILYNLFGVMLLVQDMQVLVELLCGMQIYLIFDEVYEYIIYDGCCYELVLCYLELCECVFVIFSFGKIYYCIGWKIGYVIVLLVLIVEFCKVYQYNMFISFGLVQYGFVVMICDEFEYYLELGVFYQVKCDCFCEQLVGICLKVLLVLGGYFQLVDYLVISDLLDYEFVKWLIIEKGVIVILLLLFYEIFLVGQCLVCLCFVKNEVIMDVVIECLWLL